MEEQRNHTLSGMVMVLLRRLRQTVDSAERARWRLEVVDVDGKRVDKASATRLRRNSRAGSQSSAA